MVMLCLAGTSVPTKSSTLLMFSACCGDIVDEADAASSTAPPEGTSKADAGAALFFETMYARVPAAQAIITTAAARPMRMISSVSSSPFFFFFGAGVGAGVGVLVDTDALVTAAEPITEVLPVAAAAAARFEASSPDETAAESEVETELARSLPSAASSRSEALNEIEKAIDTESDDPRRPRRRRVVSVHSVSPKCCSSTPSSVVASAEIKSDSSSSPSEEQSANGQSE